MYKQNIMYSPHTNTLYITAVNKSISNEIKNHNTLEINKTPEYSQHTPNHDTTITTPYNFLTDRKLKKKIIGHTKYTHKNIFKTSPKENEMKFHNNTTTIYTKKNEEQN